MTTAYTTGRLRLKPGTLGAPILETEAREVAKVLYHGGSEDAEAHGNARRLMALWNAVEGIPTETLEAGVVVVPVELIDAVRSVVEAHREECESGSDTGVVHKLEHLYDVFSRLQQNGGENACGN